MKTTIKVLAAALAAVALMAAEAAANGPLEFKAAEYPATVTLQADASEPTQDFELKELGNVTTCSAFSAKSSLEGDSGTLGATNVAYSGCHATFVKLESSVAMNGCHYALDLQAEASESTSTGSLDIECTTKKGILIDIDNGACVVEIPGGQQLSGVEYHEVSVEGKALVTADVAAIEEVEASYEGPGCGEGTDDEASITGKLVAAAENEAEEGLDLTVERESTPKEPADFWADEEAVQIDITGDSNHAWFVPGVGTLTCNEEGAHDPPSALHAIAEYSGEAEALTGEEIEYTNCHATFLEFPVTVDMNSCHYKFEAGTMVSEDTAEGSVEIDCVEPGDSIAFTAFNDTETHEELVCEMHVPGGQKLGGITYHNVEDGEVDAVTTTIEIEDELETEITEGALCNEGTVTTGDYTGETISTATNELGEFVDHTVTGTP